MSRGARSGGRGSVAPRGTLRGRTASARVLQLASAVVLVASSSACFATRGDMRILQGDINTVRTESQRSAQAQAQALTETARILQAVSDSLSRLSSRQLGFEGDTRGELRRVNEQLIQVQQLLGQSQNIIRSLRADLEAAGRTPIPESAVAPPPTTASPPARGSAPPVTPAPAAGAVPGPNQLYQDGRQHYERGSYASSRIAFGDLLLNYPGSDLAPDAQYLIAESYAAERNFPAAETAYAAVVSKYPDSPRAPEAMYKRALIFLEDKNVAAARPLLEAIIRQYPRTDAAEFARERLASIP